MPLTDSENGETKRERLLGASPFGRTIECCSLALQVKRKIVLSSLHLHGKLAAGVVARRDDLFETSFALVDGPALQGCGPARRKLGAEISTRCFRPGALLLYLPSVIVAKAVPVLPSTGVKRTTPSLMGCPSSVTSPRTSPWAGPSEQPPTNSKAAGARHASVSRRNGIRAALGVKGSE